MMITKTDLQEFRRCKMLEQDLLLRLKELTATKENLHAMAVHGGGSSGGKSSPVESAIIQIEKIQELYCRRLTERIQKQIEIEEELSRLEPIDSAIIRGYYLAGHKWETVALSLGYDTRSVTRRHKLILEQLAA